MHYDYKTKNVCSRKVSFDIENGIISNIKFVGGCDGNLNAISKILEGAKAEEVVSKLIGNDCMGKGTSCADQLARAVRDAIEK